MAANVIDANDTTNEEMTQFGGAAKDDTKRVDAT
jgi:hypothetical protein